MFCIFPGSSLTDKVGPVIICPPDMIIKRAEIDSSTSRIWWPFVGISDNNNRLLSITCDSPLMSEFAIGVTHVICHAMDNEGNSGGCGLDVHNVCK